MQSYFPRLSGPLILLQEIIVIPGVPPDDKNARLEHQQTFRFRFFSPGRRHFRHFDAERANPPKNAPPPLPRIIRKRTRLSNDLTLEASAGPSELK